MQRHWKIKTQSSAAVSKELLEACGGQPILAQLMAIRGITDPQEATAFLNLDQYEPTDPSEFPAMGVVVERLQKAIDEQEPILIYGDFDVDGVTGTSILFECFTTLGANVSYYVPDRHTEGHGLNTASLCRLVSSRQLKVVITTDTGSSNFNEVSLLNGLGVDTIITDHHELPENLPQALAILNPKLLDETSPFAFLSGAGVAFVLSQALLSAYDHPQKTIDALLDLTAIGTVVDMVPLRRENRYLVWRGLQKLQARERIGVKAILAQANVNETAPINTTTLGFTIGPRINAIGRLANAAEAVELMTTTDTERADQLAAKLEQLNRNRKELVDKVLLQAESHLQATGELTGQKAIIMASEDWNPGVVGLVATRLIDKFNRPCFLGYLDAESQEARFSARSIEGFDMHANLQNLEDLFIRWGGHAGAAGFAIAQKDLGLLKSRLFALCQDKITEEQLIPTTEVDMVIEPSQVSTYLIEMIERMDPFGQENPQPIFALERMKMGAQRNMGENQQHLKLIFNTAEPGRYLEGVYWNWPHGKLDPNHTFRLAFTPELNHFNGSVKVQMLLKDVQDEQAPRSVVPSAQHVAPIQAPQPQAKVAAPEAPQSVGESAGLQWHDERSPGQLEALLNQLMQGQSGQFRVFSEGTQSFFPIPLSESAFCSRNGGTPTEQKTHLVLWDLPADLDSLLQLLATQTPQQIYLVGGKYTKIPMARPARDILEGLFKVISAMCKTTSTVPLSNIVQRLSVTETAVLSGLGVLEQAQWLRTQVNPETKDVSLTLNPSPPALNPDLLRSAGFLAFQQQMQAITQFRQWLMQAPLDTIQLAVGHAPQAKINLDTNLIDRKDQDVCLPTP